MSCWQHTCCPGFLCSACIAAVACCKSGCLSAKHSSRAVATAGLLCCSAAGAAGTTCMQLARRLRCLKNQHHICGFEVPLLSQACLISTRDISTALHRPCLPGCLVRSCCAWSDHLQFGPGVISMCNNAYSLYRCCPLWTQKAWKLGSEVSGFCTVGHYAAWPSRSSSIQLHVFLFRMGCENA